jgi:hypothetical protein
MIVQCPQCGLAYNDEFRWTICPHETFAANDGKNNFHHHPESYLEKKPMPDLNRAPELNQEIEAQIEDAFEYHPWTEIQKVQGQAIREALAHAFKVIIQNAPPSPDRTVALRKLREARMDANSAITHGGKY